MASLGRSDRGEENVRENYQVGNVEKNNVGLPLAQRTSPS
jgi:hypothetical protein